MNATLELESEKIVIDKNKEMTVNEYAKYLGISRNTVNTWVNRKQILYRKIAELNDLILVQVGTEKKL
jgi:DNA-binding transcriptional regulator YiaG